jgi:putative tryptophan/tyrosine transport system substrate-binding protein
MATETKKAAALIIVLVSLLVIALGAVWFLLVPAPSADDSAREAEPYRIAIVSLVDIEPITQLREGFERRIGESALRTGVVYSHFAAQGDMTRLPMIADRLASNPPDLVYVLGTPAAQAIQGRIPSLPIVQGAVTDPVAANLAASWEASGRAYTGVSDFPPAEVIAALGHALIGTHGRLSVIYNPGEANSVSVVRRLRQAARSFDFEIIDVPVGAVAEIPTATQAALIRGDGIFIPPDNTVTTASRGIIRAARRAGEPVIGTTETLLLEGATAVVALDFRALGAESADLAVRILQGENPSRIAIRVPSNPDILVSTASIRTLNIPRSRFAGIRNVRFR